MNIEDKNAIVARAAHILLEAEGRPVSLDELFPAFKVNGGGLKKPGRKWQRSLMTKLVEHRFAIRARGAQERYLAGDQDFLRGLVKEWLATRVILVEGEEDWNMRRKYSAAFEEKRGRANVAYQALRRLLAAKSPQTRQSLFVPQKGDKFQERAALVPNWQVAFMRELCTMSIIKAVSSEGKVHYDLLDRQAAQDLYDDAGSPCVYTMLDPSDPCMQVHSKTPSGSPNSSHRSGAPALPLSEPEVIQAAEPAPESAQAPEETPAPSAEPTGLEATLTKILKAISIQHELNRGVIGDVANTLQLVSDSYNKVEDRLDNFATRLGHLEQTVNSGNAAVAKAAAELSNVASGMSTQVRSAVSVAQAPALTMKGELEALKTELASFKTEFRSSRRQRLEALLGRMDTAATELDALKDLAIESMLIAAKA